MKRFLLLLLIATGAWGQFNTTQVGPRFDWYKRLKVEADSIYVDLTDTTITALRSASKIVNWDLSSAEYMGRCFAWGESGCLDFRNNLDEFRAVETNGSLYRDEGLRLPTRGSAEVTDGGDTLRVVNLDTKAVAWSIVIAANNALGSSAITGVVQQDGHIFVSTGSGVYDLDLWQDKSTLYSTAGVSVYNARLTSRNAASGFTVMSATPAIVNDTVYSVAVTRSPFSGLAGTDPVTGMQRLLWGVATAGGTSTNVWKIESGVPTMYIYDMSSTNPKLAMDILPTGYFLVFEKWVTRNLIYLMRPIWSITADGFTPWVAWVNDAPGAQKLRWPDPTQFLGIAAIPGASGSGNNSPRVYAAADSGLYILDTKANDNTNGCRREINRRWVSPSMCGDTRIAWSGASSALLAGGEPAQGITSVMTYAYTDTSAVGASATFNGTNGWITIPDHQRYSFTTDTADSAFTVTARIKTQGSVSIGIISKAETDNGREWMVYINNPGRLVLEMWDGGGGWIKRTSADVVRDGRWHTVTATYDGSASGSGAHWYIDGALSDSATTTAGSYTAMERNAAAPVVIGAAWHTSGTPAIPFYGWMEYVTVESGVRPQLLRDGAMAMDRKSIESPSPDTLYAAPTGIVAKDGLVYLWSASHVEVRDQGGALVDTFRCTGCGTIQTVAPWPTRTDSLAFRIGGSGGIRDVTPNAKLMDLATAEPSGASNFKGINGVVVLDSAGLGDAWTIRDAAAMAANVGITEIAVGKGTFPDTTTITQDYLHIFGQGRNTLFTNNATDGGPALIFAGDSLHVENLTFKTDTGGAGGNQDAVTFSGDFPYVKNVTCLDADDDCFNITSSYGTFEGLRVIDADGAGIFLGDDNNQVHGSVVFSTGSSALAADANADAFQVNDNNFGAENVTLHVGADGGIIDGNILGTLQDYGTGNTSGDNE